MCVFKTSLILAFILVCNFIAPAQFRRDTISTTTTWAVQFLDQDNGYVVGNSGTAFKTNDRGGTWQTLTTGFTQGLRDIHFFDADTGIVVGTSGRIAITNNGGQTWSTTANVPTIGYLALEFIDRNTGFAGGGGSGFTGIIRTQDGGTTWDTVASSLPGSPFEIYFINDSIGLACGVFGMIRRTTDRGATWAPVATGLTTTPVLNSIAFINDTVGWIVGQNGTLLKTEDAGGSWTPQTSPVSVTLNSICASDDSSLYACGASGTLVFSRDYGQSWTSKNLGQSSTLQNVFFTSSNVGYVVGSGGVVIKSSTAFLDSAVVLFENFDGINPANLKGWEVDSSQGKPWVFENPNFLVNQINNVLDTPYALFDPSLFIQSGPDTAYLYFPEIDLHSLKGIDIQWNEAFSHSGSPVTSSVEILDNGLWTQVYSSTTSPSNLGPGISGSSPKRIVLTNLIAETTRFQARFKYTGPVGAFAWWAVDDVKISTDTTPGIVSFIGSTNVVQDDVQIFPNPVFSDLTITNVSEDNLEFEIYNILGGSIKKASLKANETKAIDVSNWSAGVYTVVLKGTKSKTYKVIRH